MKRFSAVWLITLGWLWASLAAAATLPGAQDGVTAP